MAAERISPRHAHEHRESDSNALLVCAYDSEQKLQQNRLEGAISLDQFRSRVDSLSRDREVIFYCA